MADCGARRDMSVWHARHLGQGVGLDESVELLEQTLEEEKATDEAPDRALGCFQETGTAGTV